MIAPGTGTPSPSSSLNWWQVKTPCLWRKGVYAYVTYEGVVRMRTPTCDKIEKCILCINEVRRISLAQPP